MSNPLRNKNINYARGWFSITVQVAHNKSVFGAVVGETCALNELGLAVQAAWRSHPAHNPGLYIDEFVVMPNHFHAIIKLSPPARWPGAHDIYRNPPPTAVGEHSTPARWASPPARWPGGYDIYRGPPPTAVGVPPITAVGAQGVIGRFKSYSNHLYLELKKAGRCVDIGPRLWQSSFYDNLISDYRELCEVRRYFRDNPKNWNQDRFGPVTGYGVGNPELLSCNLVAFVASETRPSTPTAVGGGPGEWQGGDGLKPREWQGDVNPIKTTTSHKPQPISRGPQPAPPRPQPISWAPNHCGGGAGVTPVISTFTSPEERAMRDKCLRARRPFVWVSPGGIWSPLPPAIERACDEGWAFVCSPVPSGTGVNKKRSIWCNQYVVKQAQSVWVGSIRKGGSLETILTAVRGAECRKERFHAAIVAVPERDNTTSSKKTTAKQK